LDAIPFRPHESLNLAPMTFSGRTHERRSRALSMSALRRSKPLFAKPQSTSHIATIFSVARFTILVRPRPPTPSSDVQAVARSCETATQNVSRRDRQTGARDGAFRINCRLDSLMACHPYQKIYLSANCITRLPLLLVTKPKLALVGAEFAPFQLG